MELLHNLPVDEPKEEFKELALNLFHDELQQFNKFTNFTPPIENERLRFWSTFENEPDIEF